MAIDSPTQSEGSSATPKPTKKRGSRLLRPVRDFLAAGDLGLVPVFVALVAIWIIFQSLSPHFISPRNLTNLIVQIVVIGVLALGETLVLLLGEIDLSIAQVSGMAAAILASLSVFDKLNPWAAMALTLAAGAAFGMAQGLWITLIGVPSFIVTLAGSLVSLGLLLGLIGTYGTISLSSTVILAIATSFVPRWMGLLFAAILIVVYLASLLAGRWRRAALQIKGVAPRNGFGRFAALSVLSILVVVVLNSYRGLPWAGVIVLALVILFSLLTRSTPYGRYLYAMGGNAEAARRAGVNVRAIRVSIFSLAGMLAAFGGIVGASRLGSASASTGGGNLLLDSIAAAVIGGTSLFGGRGSVYGALAGALVLGSVENGMDLIGAPSSTRFVAEGLILLLAVTIDTLLRARRLRMGRA